MYTAWEERTERIPIQGDTAEYLYDPWGEDIGHYDATQGYWYDEYIPFGGRTLAEYKASTPPQTVTQFYHPNALGSRSMATDALGNYVEETVYNPLGQSWQSTGAIWDQRFGGMPIFDADLGLDATAFRMYAPLQGRWLTPDPAGGDLTNPQSFNRYAYVLNNPTTLIDPLGLYQFCPNGQTDNQCNPPPGGGGGGGGGGGSSNPPGVCAQVRFATFAHPELRPPCAGVGGGGGGGTVSPPKPAPPTAKPLPQPCGTSGFGGGIGIALGGNADLGVGLAGVTGTGSVGAGLFYGSGTGASGGAFASGGAAAYALGLVTAVPNQNVQPVSLGAFAGGGASIFFTNARSVQQLSGPFTAYSLNVGLGPVKFSVQYASAGSISVISIGPPYAGLSIGASATRVVTNTMTQQRGCK
ncbi:MAG: RHS repeat-associated core domain-containing protein [Terriglobia bacterium]